MTPDTVAERATRTEGILEHLATKADVERQTVRLYVALTVATGIILAAIRLWT